MSKKDKYNTDNEIIDSVYNEIESVYDLINKYGTYNIQPTANTQNEFPKIAQGITEQTEEKNDRR